MYKKFTVAFGTALLAAGVVQAADISGAGATFPAPVYSKWAAAYEDYTGNQLNYQAIGSGGGRGPPPPPPPPPDMPPPPKSSCRPTTCRSTVIRKACAKCAAACEKFPDDAHMKKCAAECRKCEKACKDMLAHARHGKQG